MFLRAMLRPLVNREYQMSSHSSKRSLIDLNFQHKIESNFWGCRQVRRRMFHRAIPKRKALKRICRLTCLIHFKRREPSASCAKTTSSRTIRMSSCFRNSNRREFQFNFLTEIFQKISHFKVHRSHLWTAHYRIVQIQAGKSREGDHQSAGMRSHGLLPQRCHLSQGSQALRSRKANATA